MKPAKNYRQPKYNDMIKNSTKNKYLESMI